MSEDPTTTAALRTQAFADSDAERLCSSVHPEGTHSPLTRWPWSMSLCHGLSKNTCSLSLREHLDTLNKQPYCDDCRAMVHGIEDLRFPVFVLVGAVPDVV